MSEEAGQARLDAAFAEPPTTSEQLLHPEPFLRGEADRPPSTAPKAEGKEIDQGVLGELGLLLVLNASGDVRPAGRRRAGAATATSPGEDGDDTCVRVTSPPTPPPDDAELRQALGSTRHGTRDGVTVTGRGPAHDDAAAAEVSG